MAEYMKAVKTLLGIDDQLQDALLEQIQANTIALFKAKTGAKAVPESLEFMIIEVMVKRYNRIGNEGMLQERQADLLQVFDQSDFDVYKDILDREFRPPDTRQRGAVLWR